MICTDRLSGRRRNLLMELIATASGIYHLFSPPSVVTVYRITGKRDHVPASEAVSSDCLRFFVTTETTKPQARAATRYYFNEIARKPNDTFAGTASQLTDAFRDSIEDCDLPHASEIILFWRYIPEDKLETPMRRLSVMVTSTASERADRQYTVRNLSHQVAEK